MLTTSPRLTTLLETSRLTPPLSAILGETESGILGLDLAARRCSSLFLIGDKPTDLLQNIACTAAMRSSHEELRIIVFTIEQERWDFLYLTEHLSCMYTPRQMVAASREVNILAEETYAANHNQAPADYPTCTLLIIDGLSTFLKGVQGAYFMLHWLIEAGYHGGTCVVASDTIENLIGVHRTTPSFEHLCVSRIEENNLAYELLHMEEIEPSDLADNQYYLRTDKQWQTFHLSLDLKASPLISG